MDGQWTSYCGLYCRDCVPSNDALFSLLKRLERMLEGLHLADYAAMKAVKSPVFREFDEYFVVLAGEYTVIVEGKETPVGPGQEMVIPKGIPHGGRFMAGTRTIHAFGGRRAERETNIK